MTTHDHAVWLTWAHLRTNGVRTCFEVGVPGGRADLVCVDRKRRWTRILEVKTSAQSFEWKPERSFEQLHRYAAHLSSRPTLTLVAPIDRISAPLVALAQKFGCGVWGLDFEYLDTQFPDGLKDAAVAPYVELPYLSKAIAA